MSDQRRKAFEVEWRIEHLRSWFEVRNDTLYSPQFLVETLSNTCWKLSLSRKLHLGEKYISLALERNVEDDHPEPIAFDYELSFLACDGSTLKSKSGATKFSPKTVSRELNVKEVEIFEVKKEAYLPEGVLTVHCQFRRAFLASKGGRCSMISVIGRKCISMDGTIKHLNRINPDNRVMADFISSSSDISFISFYVCVDTNYQRITFERKKVECKSLNLYYFKLFGIDHAGQKTEFRYNGNHTSSLLNLNESCSFQTYKSYTDILNYAHNDTKDLTVHLEITYYPGVQSECVEYEGKPNVQETVDTSKSEKVHSQFLDYPHLSQHEQTCHSEKIESCDENECFDAVETKQLPSTTLKDDLSSMYNDRLFCDTKLQTDTETFPAHRNVLSARSPVFKKMFTTDMREKAGECINVPDLSSDTVRRMLQFLYTDCTGDLDMQNAKDLYNASDKYDIASLKQRCSSFIKRNLCPSNVCEVIVLADMHQDKDLESAAHEFVLTYDQEVFGSDEWRQFMKNFSSLAAEVMFLKCLKK